MMIIRYYNSSRVVVHKGKKKTTSFETANQFPVSKKCAG